MNDWQPLSVRRGLKPVPTFHREVLGPLAAPLYMWLRTAWGDSANMAGKTHLDVLFEVALATDVAVTYANVADAQQQIIQACAKSNDVFLDVVDATLMVTRGRLSMKLDSLLSHGHSAWTTSADGKSLAERVDPTSTEAAAMSASPADEAGRELREAWDKAYGLHVDASDAWDHAIKAVEAILIPIVVGKKDKANLGSVAGELKANPGRWSFTLGPIETVEAMIRLMWPNPDRHAGADRNEPHIEHSRGVVHNAVLLVQWARDGLIVLATKQ